MWSDERGTSVLSPLRRGTQSRYKVLWSVRAGCVAAAPSTSSIRWAGTVASIVDDASAAACAPAGDAGLFSIARIRVSCCIQTCTSS